MAHYDLCIDFGSGNTTIYKKGSGVVLREPTLALVETSGKNLKVLKIGCEAERLYGKNADNEVFVRPVVEGVVKNVSLSQKILSYFLNKVVKYRFVKPNIKVIVLLPVGLEKIEYEDYKSVFYGIGFAKIDFVYNVVASSLVDMQYFTSGRASVLVNIGAGKTEIASIVNNKIINACSLNIGGNNIDKAIVEHLQQTNGYIISNNIAKKLKEEIGSLYQTDKSNMEVVVHDASANSQLKTVVNAKDIAKPIYENYFKIAQTVQAFINGSSPEVEQDVKNEGILLCGGGADTAGIEVFLKKILKLSVFVLDNKEILGAIGGGKLFSDAMLLDRIVKEN